MKTEIICETLGNQAAELEQRAKAATNISIEYFGAKQAARQIGDKVAVHFAAIVSSVESDSAVNDPDTRALILRFVKEFATRMGKVCAEAYQNASEGSLKEEGKALMATSTVEGLKRQIIAIRAAAEIRDAEPAPKVEDPEPLSPPVVVLAPNLKKLRKK